MTNDSTKTRNEKFVYMKLLETEAISINDDECIYFNEYGSVKRACDLLNELNNKNTYIKQTLDDMIESERTELGRSVLKQFKEAIQ